MKDLNTAIADALKFDPLGHAERLTGESYKTDKGTEALGFLMHIEHAKNKSALLELAGDTHFSMSWSDLKALLAKVGFVIYHTHRHNSEDGTPNEAILCFDKSRGALLWAESYNGDRINSGTVYFNWRYPEGGEWWLHGASCAPTKEERVRCSSYDIREGLLYNLRTVEERGEFVTPWVARPFLWLLTHWDSKPKDYSYDKINAERLTHLPHHVLAAITPAS